MSITASFWIPDKQLITDSIRDAHLSLSPRLNIVALGVNDDLYLCKDEVDVVLVGTEDGRVLFMHSSGECLLELEANAGSVRAFDIRVDSVMPDVAVLCSSVIISLNLEDIRHVLSKSLREFLDPDLREINTTRKAARMRDLFSHVVTKSIDLPGEPSDSSWNSSTVQTVWLVTGRKPFISFNISEETSTASLTSLLYASAKQAILGSSRNKKDYLEVTFTDHYGEPVTPFANCPRGDMQKLTLMHGMADQRRRIVHSNMVISSDRCWMAVPDDLGRVLLVDLRKKRIVRMWKGYRDAELAFVDAVESTGQSGMRSMHVNKSTLPDVASSSPTASPARSTHCLFIHAPHLRLVEVWRLTHGPRLATWDVEEPVRLISAQPTWLGPRPTRTGENPSSKLQAFMMDSRAVLYTLTVSPELCLSGTNTDAVVSYLDYQLMQECFACLLRSHSEDPNAVCAQLIQLFSKFQTATWFERSLLHVVHHLGPKPHVLLDFLKDCVQLLHSPISCSIARDPTGKPADLQRLHAVCDKLLALARLYVKFSVLTNNCLHETNTGWDDDAEDNWANELENMADLLSWDLEDAERCMKVYNFCGSILKPSALLKLSRPMELHAFIDCFTFQSEMTNTVTEVKAKSEDAERAASFCVRVHLRPDDSPVRLAKIGSLLFGPYILGHQSFKGILKEIDNGILPASLLLTSLVHFLLYWDICHQIAVLSKRAHRLMAHLLACLSSPQQHHQASSSPSPNSWLSDLERVVREIRDRCMNSSQLSSAYLVSLLLRSLFYTMWQATEQGTDLSVTLWACTQENITSDITFETEATVDSHSPSESKQPQPTSLQCDSVEFETEHEMSTTSPRLSLAALGKMVDQWHDTCAQLEGLFFLGLLVQLPPTDGLLGSVNRREMATPTGFPITLGRALTFGRACLTELFASWLIRGRMEPDALTTFYQTLCTLPTITTTDVETVAASTEELEPSNSALALISSSSLRQTLFPLVYKRLPFTLELDTVMATVSWMHYQLWLDEPEALCHLQRSIEYLRQFSSAGSTISQGLATLMWQGRLRFSYGQCVLALTPNNDAKAQGFQRVKLNKNQLRHLSVLLITFFNVYSNACHKAEVIPVFSVEREWQAVKLESSIAPESTDAATELPGAFESFENWKQKPTEKTSRTSEPTRRSSGTSGDHDREPIGRNILVAESAAAQSSPNIKSVASWEQAVIVVAALTVFGCPTRPNRRGSRGTYQEGTGQREQTYSPDDFFASKDSYSIMVSFNADWISTSSDNPDRDSSLHSRRRFFLCWLVERAVHFYRSSSPGSVLRDSRAGSEDRTVPAVVDSWRAYESLDLYRSFTTAALNLARHWGFAKDMVISLHVLSLFELNLDDQAELYLTQVQDLPNLATRLLLIVGRRVASLCYSSEHSGPEQLRWRAYLSYDVSSWIQALFSDDEPDNETLPNSQSASPEKELDRLVRLIDVVLQHLPSSASQLTMAEQLRDCIYAMLE